MAVIAIGDYDAHVRLWTDMLRTFIGCSDSQVARWAAHFKNDIADANSIFYNQPPEYYVARNLVPQCLERKLEASSYVKLEASIQGVLQDLLESATTIEDIDWKLARSKVDSILAEHGESLTRVAQEKADWRRDC